MLQYVFATFSHTLCLSPSLSHTHTQLCLSSSQPHVDEIPLLVASGRWLALNLAGASPGLKGAASHP